MVRIKAHIDKLKVNDVLTGPLQSEAITRWISNPVNTSKRWDSDQISVNLDLPDMKKSAKPTHFPMTKAED